MQSTSEEFVKSLGQGAYGSVGLVKYTKTDGSSFQAAVKTSDVDDYESLNKEFQILSELSGYPNIVQCFSDDVDLGLTDEGYFLCQLLLEYASHGSLTTFMDRYTDRKLPELMIRDFTRMILQGLVSIHGQGYVHCDLKPDNLLVFFPSGDDSSYELKITDFGNSLKVGQVPEFWEIDYPFVGTPIYMPPESFHDGIARKTLDLWSLGCLVLEMYTGKRPWTGIDDPVPLIFDGNAPEVPESVPCDAREFIEKCFSRNPEERGSASELLSHRFLIREEVKTEEKVIDVSVAQETRSSLLWKLKLRIRRRGLKKATDIPEKPLKPKNVYLFKPPQFKKIWNKLLRLKTMPMKLSASNLISVQ